MGANTDSIDRTIRALRKNRIDARHIDSIPVLFSTIDTFILPGMTVGCGDSETMHQMHIHEYLKRLPITYLDKYAPSLSKEEKRAIYIGNFSADVFFSGINAVTENGRIFNLDGNGSRVAPILYGPKKVVLVCGTNKIVASAQEAYERIRTIAAPTDAKRLHKRTPCTITGTCMDCSSPDRICNYQTIIQGQFDKDRIMVLLIDGSYGF